MLWRHRGRTTNCSLPFPPAYNGHPSASTAILVVIVCHEIADTEFSSVHHPKRPLFRGCRPWFSHREKKQPQFNLTSHFRGRREAMPSYSSRSMRTPHGGGGGGCPLDFSLSSTFSWSLRLPGKRFVANDFRSCDGNHYFHVDQLLCSSLFLILVSVCVCFSFWARGNLTATSPVLVHH